MFISIDPGNKKCGLILADIDSSIALKAKVVKTDSVIALIKSWQLYNKIDLIILGNGTSSKSLELEIKSKISIPVKLVEEKNTTLRARDRYWEIWPKNFLLTLIPKGMIIPPGNLDAIAALVLLEDYLRCKLLFQEKNDVFKIWPEQ